MSAVAVDQVTKVYDGGVLAVDDVSLEVDPGELLVLLGPSGCGKTTILRMIAGLEDPTDGQVMLNGHIANELPPHERNVAMVFQDLALYPHLTVRDNLAFPLRISGQADEAVVQDRIREIAHGLQISETLDRKPAMLSGGQRQRVAMGRALIRGKPAVLLMDEPLASLDVGLRSGLRAEIASLIRSLKVTTIYVTHDQVEAMSLADRIAVMRDGVIEDIGTPGRIYSDPGTAFVAAFLGSPPINLAWATIWVMNGDRVIIDFGTQHLELDWADVRSESLTPYHGQPVIVGIRPENLIPYSRASTDGTGQSKQTPAVRSADGSPRTALRGRVGSLEYHGYEWLAQLEVGFRSVDLNRVSTRPGQGAPKPDAHGHHGEHRKSQLLVRLGSPRGWAIGEDVTVTVDVPHIHVFAADGRRIGSWQTMDLSAGRGWTSAWLAISVLDRAPSLVRMCETCVCTVLRDRDNSAASSMQSKATKVTSKVRDGMTGAASNVFDTAALYQKSNDVNTESVTPPPTLHR